MCSFLSSQSCLLKEFLENVVIAGKTPIKVNMMDFSLVNPHDTGNIDQSVPCSIISGSCNIKIFKTHASTPFAGMLDEAHNSYCELKIANNIS